jgi:hypothetical protein
MSAGGGVVRRDKQQRGRTGKRTPPPLGAGVTIFHVRDAAPVKELLAALHSRLGRKRSESGIKRGGRTLSRKGRRVRDGDHPPLYLVDDDHLIAFARSLALANTIRRAIEKALGAAVQHVETRFVKAPKAAAAGAPRGPRGQG